MAKDKVRRPRAETPKGFRDYRGAEVTERAWMLARIAEVYHAHGFDALETSAVETVEALGKFLPDVDRPNEGVFAWQEDDTGSGADWLALRYDLTAPLARFYAQNRNDLPTPYRRYAMGPVWRNEKPGPGRFRQFYQCDADTVGTASVAADAEICMMLCDTLEAVGIPRGDYVVKVNNRKVLNGVLEAARLPDSAERERGIVLRAIDKFDRLGLDGVRALLGKGRKDESGDITEGAGLAEEQIEAILSLLQPSSLRNEAARDQPFSEGDESVAEVSPAAMQIEGQPPSLTRRDRHGLILDWERPSVGASAIGQSGIAELDEIVRYVRASGYDEDRIRIDTSIVRGLGYYTGPVFEAELTFEIEDEKGRPQRYGSVAGGGRYDDLVKRFTGQEVPATGVSIGVDRLLAALRAKGRIGTDAAEGPVVVTVMDRDRMADYQAMAAELRGAGIRAEVYLGNPKNFGNQLKYADRRQSPVAIIEGADEKARGVVQVKDLVQGAKIAESASLEEWKDQPAQVEVPRGDLVATVRQMLSW